jgi:hypothetical protein
MAYTTIDDPSAHFHTQLYNSNNGYAVSVVNDANAGDFKPDLLWVKSRSDIGGYEISHNLIDSSRGVTKTLFSDTTAAETTASQSNYDLTSFDTDGFTNGAPESTNSRGGGAVGKVAWQWKANGGTTASNSDGSITSTVQANTTAGFSIVTFTSASSGNFSVGHGLGVQPAMIITKSRDGTSNWWTWHKGLTGGNSNTSYIVALERTTAEASYANAWGSTGVTSSVFGMQSGNTAEASDAYVAYCWAEKQGYSKFSSYIGNGNANGTFVYTGFKPAYVVVKRADATNNWICTDNARGKNGVNPRAYLDLNDAEGSAADYIDHLSNGFKIRTSAGSMNTSGGKYIYTAFAESPFVTSKGVPSAAR